MPYIKVGGIGMICEQPGQLPMRRVPRFGALSIVEPYEHRELRQVDAPADGWTSESLFAALEEVGPVAQAFDCVDALVGDRWLGSTEL